MVTRLLLIFGIVGFISSHNLLNAQTEAAKLDSVFSGVNKIVLDADFCAVKIAGYDENNISVKGLITSAENQTQYNIDATVSAMVLNIKITKPSQWKSHWGELSLSVPEGVAIEITTQSGKLELSSLKGTDVQFNSKSGHLVVSDFKGKLSSNSPAGDISISKFEGDLNAKSKTGFVSLTNAAGNLVASSDKGDFLVQDVKGNLKVYGGSGTQDVKNVEGDLFFKSTNGDIKMSLAKGSITTRTFEGNQKIFQTEGVFNVQASTGSITGNRIKFTASSTFATTEGDIKVQMDTKTDLAFDLKSENSFLRALGKSKKKSLKEGKGSIVITGTSTSGAQAYY